MPEFVDASPWLPCKAGDGCETKRAAAAAISPQLAVPDRDALDGVSPDVVSDVWFPASDEPALPVCGCPCGAVTCTGRLICIRAMAGHASVFRACCSTFRASCADDVVEMVSVCWEACDGTAPGSAPALSAAEGSDVLDAADAARPCPSWSRFAVRSLTIVPKVPLPPAPRFRAVPDEAGVAAAVFCGDTAGSGDDNGVVGA
ncbi:hypothetical protein AA13595_0967 [Gluconacetobacter johannae DSM 13595]|nr:hypothetical protein AA13595_0967 [Gluconacetobacter johannae DSM 13595]